MKSKNTVKTSAKTTMGLLCAMLAITGCATMGTRQPVLTDMQMISLCQTSEKAIEAEKKITAEYGFKRFAENTYRPVLEQHLFGHEVRVIEITPTRNKVYVAGNPREFGHHYQWVLPEVNCENNSCQALLTNEQTLHIYKHKAKRAKDTTVVECTKAVEPQPETTSTTNESE